MNKDNSNNNEPHILVVDDDGYNRRLFVQILKLKKYAVDEAESGERALEKIANGHYDVIVTDLQMYQVGGMEVLEAAKRMDKYVQVLILTGYGSISTAVQAMQEGAYDYLTKPFNHETFLMRIEKALEQRRMEMLVEEQKKKIEEFHRMIEKDLNLAERVQNSLVPLAFDNEHVSLGVEYLPMIGIGGDFADVYDDHNGHFYMTIIDVTGHGIAAALLVNRVCSEINKLVRDGKTPSQVLHFLNAFFFESFAQTGLFLTIHSLMVDYHNHIIYQAGSAHPVGLLYHIENGEIEQMDPQNPIVGFSDVDEETFVQSEYRYGPGDRIVLYTDGIIEAENIDGNPYGLSGLLDSLRECSVQTVHEAATNMVNRVRDYGHGDPRDDILLMIAQLS